MGLLDLLVKRSSRGPQRAEGAARRAARIPTADLPAWADQCGFEVGRWLLQYSRDGEGYALDEAFYAAEGQLAIINEMKRRHSSM